MADKHQGVRTQLDVARQLYKEVNGDKIAFMKRVSSALPTLTVNTARAYFANVDGEAAGNRRFASAVLIGRSNGNQPVSEPVKRTIVVMLEMELTEEEDTFQTAELAVELLNGDMDNQITLIAAAEKSNG